MTDDRIKAEQSLLLQINTLGRNYRRVLNRVLAEHGLSESQALPIIFIARLGEGVRQGVLADKLAIVAPSLVRQLDQLCSSGLVERRDDPHDRRAKCLYLTDEGRTLSIKIEALVVDCRSRLLSGIDDADLFAAHRALSQLNETVDQVLLSGDTSTHGQHLG